jgi:hypothetical protein
VVSVWLWDGVSSYTVADQVATVKRARSVLLVELCLAGLSIDETGHYTQNPRVARSVSAMAIFRQQSATQMLAALVQMFAP